MNILSALYILMAWCSVRKLWYSITHYTFSFAIFYLLIVFIQVCYGKFVPTTMILQICFCIGMVSWHWYIEVENFFCSTPYYYPGPKLNVSPRASIRVVKREIAKDGQSQRITFALDGEFTHRPLGDDSSNFKIIISEYLLWIGFMSASWEIAFWWMPYVTFDDLSIWV